MISENINIKTQEIWKTITDYPDYQVSNFGRVRSHRKNKNEWRMITPAITKDGYEVVSLRKDGRIKKSFSVHRLVAKAFVSGYKEGLQVNHKDENTYNNHADNLEWITQRENNMFGTGTDRRIKTAVRRMVLQKTMSGDIIKRFYGPCDASRATGVQRSGIYAACNGKQKHAGGFRWQWDEKKDSDTYSIKHPIRKRHNKLRNLNGEKWRDVVGYEGAYSVSNLGRVCSNSNSVNSGLMRPRIVRGAYVILLVKDGKKRGFTISSLVARAFVDGYKPGLWAHHKNGNQKDNRASNLEWLKRTDRKITKGQSKPLYQLDIDGNVLAKYPSIKDAAANLGLKNGKGIVATCNSNRNSYYGYKWQWAN